LTSGTKLEVSIGRF